MDPVQKGWSTDHVTTGSCFVLTQLGPPNYYAKINMATTMYPFLLKITFTNVYLRLYLQVEEH